MADRAVGEWLPLMEYAIKKGVSLSTLRRHIKSNKVRYRVEGGKYLLFDDGGLIPSLPSNPVAHVVPDEVLLSKVRKLEIDLRIAQEEIAELKTLIALYEEKPPSHHATY